MIFFWFSAYWTKMRYCNSNEVLLLFWGGSGSGGNRRRQSLVEQGESVHPSICMYVHLYVCLYVHLSICMYVRTSVPPLRPLRG